MSLISEHPALKHPYRIRIGSGNGLIQRLSIAGNLFMALLCATLGERNLHFIETVGEVVFAFSEFLFPFLDICLRDQLEQVRFRRNEIGHIVRAVIPAGVDEISVRIDTLDRFRDKTCESIENRCHSEVVHPVYHLVFQGDGLVIPALGEIAVKL